MLRHQKKHKNSTQNGNSASDLSDDEQSTSMVSSNSIQCNSISTIPDLIPKDLSWRLQNELRKSDFFRGEGEGTSELIGNLLGISDQGMLNRVLLSSADEAAKILGIESK